MPGELEVLLFVSVINALFFVVALNAICLNTFLVILPRVVLLRNRLWCLWPSHQSVLIVPCNFDMSTRVRTTLAVSVANSWAVEFRSCKMRAVSTWSALIHCIDVSLVFVIICIVFV